MVAGFVAFCGEATLQVAGTESAALTTRKTPRRGSKPVPPGPSSRRAGQGTRRCGRVAYAPTAAAAVARQSRRRERVAGVQCGGAAVNARTRRSLLMVKLLMHGPGGVERMLLPTARVGRLVSAPCPCAVRADCRRQRRRGGGGDEAPPVGPPRLSSLISRRRSPDALCVCERARVGVTVHLYERVSERVSVCACGRVCVCM